MRRIDRLVVHHSASPRTTTVEEIRSWHKARGWRDIGYHYVIEGDGTIRKGRSLPQRGAHVRGFNATSIGVCLVGDNTESGEWWGAGQLSSLERLVAAVRLLWPNIEVLGHRDLVPTACPGLDIRALI